MKEKGRVVGEKGDVRPRAKILISRMTQGAQQGKTQGDVGFAQ